MRRSVMGWVLGIVMLIEGCQAAQPTAPIVEEVAPTLTGEVTVFAAASLTEAFTEIGEQFEATHPETSIVFNFAGSQQLAQQLGEGAPADIFASANQAQMEVATEAGRVLAGSAQPFVRNRLVVIVPPGNPKGLTTLQALAQPGLLVVLAAEEVPVGRYSLEFLDKASANEAFGTTFKEQVLANVQSYEENVRAVLSKVALGEADAGIVYSSDVAQSGGDDPVEQIAIPEDLNIIAEYPIAPVQNSANTPAAQAFIALVLSPDGQAILAKYGFLPITP